MKSCRLGSRNDFWHSFKQWLAQGNLYKLVEQTLQKDLLDIEQNLFSEAFGPTTALEFLLFKRMQAYWKNTHTDNFITGIQCTIVANVLLDIKGVHWAPRVLHEHKDLSEILGEVPSLHASEQMDE